MSRRYGESREPRHFDDRRKRTRYDDERYDDRSRRRPTPAAAARAPAPPPAAAAPPAIVETAAERSERIRAERKARREAILAKHGASTAPPQPKMKPKQKPAAAKPKPTPQPAAKPTLKPKAGADAAPKAPAPPLDDMFADDFEEAEVLPAVGLQRGNTRSGENATLTDNWDDAEGFYRVRTGETIGDGRFEVSGILGQGMFATVMLCRDNESPAPVSTAVTATGAATADSRGKVAIKMLRTQDVFRRAGQLELEILREIQRADPAGKRHNIRLLSHFDHRNHICLVFEPMDADLRQAVRALGKNVGINIAAIRMSVCVILGHFIAKMTEFSSNIVTMFYL